MFEFFKKKKQVEKVEDKIASLMSNDNALKKFYEKAQDEIFYLIDFMNENGDGIDKYGEVLFNYAVKTKFKEEDKTEHMWVKVTEFTDGYFIGKLNNKPNTMKLIKYDDEVKVLRKDVEDWILQDLLTKTKVGGFSSAYIRNNAKQG